MLYNIGQLEKLGILSISLTFLQIYRQYPFSYSIASRVAKLNWAVGQALKPDLARFG